MYCVRIAFRANNISLWIFTFNSFFFFFFRNRSNLEPCLLNRNKLMAIAKPGLSDWYSSLNPLSLYLHLQLYNLPKFAALCSVHPIHTSLSLWPVLGDEQGFFFFFFWHYGNKIYLVYLCAVSKGSFKRDVVDAEANAKMKKWPQTWLMTNNEGGGYPSMTTARQI